MKKGLQPYFTVAQLEEIAVAKYSEAASTPDGTERDELLKQALRFANRAKIKGWVMHELSNQSSQIYH